MYRIYFFPDFILHVEGSYDNIVSYRLPGASHQVPIDYMEFKSIRSTTMPTPFGPPSKITPAQTPQSPRIIPLDNDSPCSQPPLRPSIDIECLPPPLTKVPLTDPIDETLHKNSV